jgi:hypothetical protein
MLFMVIWGSRGSSVMKSGWRFLPWNIATITFRGLIRLLCVAGAPKIGFPVGVEGLERQAAGTLTAGKGGQNGR